MSMRVIVRVIHEYSSICRRIVARASGYVIYFVVVPQTYGFFSLNRPRQLTRQCHLADPLEAPEHSAIHSHRVLTQLTAHRGQ
jgi:hypothetical protein